MMSGLGVAGHIVMGTIIRLEKEQLSELKTYLSDSEKEYILVTSELSESDIIQMKDCPIIGFVTEEGGFTSHLGITARKIGLTAVVGVPGCMDFVRNGDRAILDGLEGSLMVNPRPNTIYRYEKLLKMLKREESNMARLVNVETKTADGYRVVLMGNVSDRECIKKVSQAGGEGIGLFRTEYLYVDREMLPTEQEQFEIYQEAARAMGDKPVVIRTLDAGGDHNIPYLDLEPEENPFLGCRGIRFSLSRTDIFRTQCRAILRASAYGKIRILLPMLSSLKELRRAKNMIALVKEELNIQKIPYDKNLEIGVVIETPAAAVMADLFAREADYIAIGTNDLTQYTVAADRDNKSTADVYSSCHPAVLRSIRHIIRCCKAEGTTVSICGEAARDPRLLPLFLLYGVDELSVSADQILQTKSEVAKLQLKKFERLAEEVDMLGSIEEVEKCIDAFLKEV